MLANKFFVFSFLIGISHVFCSKPSRPAVDIDNGMIQDPQVEFVFKKIFQYTNIQLEFLNSALNRGTPEAPLITDVKILGHLDNAISLERIDEKYIHLELLCNTSSSEQIIVEIQREVEAEQSFLKRAAYHTSRLYSAQLEKLNGTSTRRRDLYQALMPVHSITFCDFYLFKEDPNFVTTQVIMKKNSNLTTPSIKEFSWTFIELPKIEKITDVTKLTTPVEKFAYMFLFNIGNKQYVEGLKKLAESDQMISDALQAANMGFWTPKERKDYQINVDFYNRFNSELAAAFEEGRKEAIVNRIKNMLKFNETKDKIARNLGWTIEETEKFITDNEITPDMIVDQR